MIEADILASMEMIQDSARGIVGAGLSRIRRLRYKPLGFDRQMWSEICGLGWPGLRLAEEKGGVGLGMLPYCALAEVLGRHLVPEPLIPAILASSLLEGEGLDQHLRGERVVLPAWRDSREGFMPLRELEISGRRVTAERKYVPMAGGADDFLIIGASQAALVRADAASVTIISEGTQDGGSIATVRLDEAPCTVIALDPGPALSEAALATAAYLLGLMEGALDLTIPYLKRRVQFGRTIGNFQILQHMTVDLKLEIEITRASIEAAALQWDTERPTNAAYAAISRAKARASNAAMKVTRDCIQLHGGIGFTDEHDIGLYLRKAMVVAPQFGNATMHLKNFARLKPLTEEV